MRISDLGTITQLGRILKVENAMVTEVSIRSRTTGYLSIIYARPEVNETVTDSLRLNVSFDTDILNSFGQRMCLCDIQEGMWIDSIFSPIMERRIPPQANAYLIVVRTYNQPPLNSTTDRIAKVDINDFIFYTGDPDDADSQIKFNIGSTSTIRDKNGNPVPFRSLRPGLLVNVTHSDIQTGDIPRQAEAFHIQTL
ncbi:hypothetical protein [Lacrimispora brassicae]